MCSIILFDWKTLLMSIIWNKIFTASIFLLPSQSVIVAIYSTDCLLTDCTSHLPAALLEIAEVIHHHNARAVFTFTQLEIRASTYFLLQRQMFPSTSQF